VLFGEGEPSSWVGALRSGRVKASSSDSHGAEVLLAIWGPGALLGEVAEVDGPPRAVTVTAIDPVDALVVTAEDFISFLRAHSTAALLLLRVMCERWRDSDRKRVEFGVLDATSRVAHRLVELADAFGEPHYGGVRITVPLTQEELAGWVGASREAVSKALRSLRTRGLIETGRRTMIVHDVDALRGRIR
jgi:CRP/FNR family cyclic AMP-dependent transcriptional regulator